MGDTLHLMIGIMGNAASLLLYSTPILTFKRVIKKRSTEEFSCVPYIVALLNCLLYTWYGLPIVSNKWENLPLVTINAMGILLEFGFIFIYFCFASPKGKKMVCLAVVPVITVFYITALISGFALHDHHHRKVLVGSIGLVASVAMYGSPLVVVDNLYLKFIIAKASDTDEERRIHAVLLITLFSFLACSLWMTYGLVGHDIVLASPNIVGCPLGILQLVVYFMYRKKEIAEEPKKTDLLEKNGEGLKFQQPVISCMDCKK